LRAQQRCAAHVIPAGAAVYEEGPSEAQTLLAPQRAYRGPVQLLLNFPGGKPPAGWSPPAFYAPADLQELAYSMPPAYSGVAFLHRRRSMGGTERLVIAEVGTSGFGHPVLGHSVDIRVFAWDWATWRIGSQLTPVGGPTSVLIKLPPDVPPLQLRAAPIDERDSSHFVIDYSIGGGGNSGHIDGWLRDAGRTGWADEPSSPCEFVELAVRDGPLKAVRAATRRASYELPVTRPRVPAWRRERDGLKTDGTPLSAG
jgi:hypothetical protein